MRPPSRFWKTDRLRWTCWRRCVERSPSRASRFTTPTSLPPCWRTASAGFDLQRQGFSTLRASGGAGRIGMTGRPDRMGPNVLERLPCGGWRMGDKANAHFVRRIAHYLAVPDNRRSSHSHRRSKCGQRCFTISGSIRQSSSLACRILR